MEENLMSFLINYIKKSFTQDAEFNNVDFFVSQAFDYNKKLNCPQIAIQFLDNIENEKYSSFEAELVSNFGIQLNVFAENMKIQNIIYNAQDVATKISSKLKAFMNDIKFKQLNTNIVRLVRVGVDYSMPYNETGQVYVNVLRFDCQSIYPYDKNLENLKES